MSLEQFDAYVRRQTERVPRNSIDWDLEKEFWIRSLNTLYDRVDDILHKFIAAETILSMREYVSLREDGVGDYAAPMLTLRIGLKTIRFKPIGMIVIGYLGRVDLVGDQGVVRFVLLDAGATSDMATASASRRRPIADRVPEWRVFSSVPAPRTSELTSEGLMESIIQVAGD